MLLSKYLWPTTVRCLRSNLCPPRSMSYLPLIALQMIPSSHPMSWRMLKVFICHVRVYASFENLKSFLRSRSLPVTIILTSASGIISCSKMIVSMMLVNVVILWVPLIKELIDSLRKFLHSFWIIVMYLNMHKHIEKEWLLLTCVSSLASNTLSLLDFRFFSHDIKY